MVQDLNQDDWMQINSVQGAVVETGTLAILQSGHYCTELNSLIASFSALLSMVFSEARFK
jgi:ketopantoate reductase